jgi:hypothetical protein
MKKLLLLVMICVSLAGCGPTRVSMLDAKAGEAATAYYGNLDEMMADLRLLLSGGHIPPYKVDDGIKKGYVVTSTLHTSAIMLIPVRGIAAKGAEVDAYAIEVTVTRPDGGATGFIANRYYTILKRVFESKYPVVRVK